MERPVSTAPAAAPYPRPAVAWYACVLLFLAYLLAFVDRTVIGLLVVPIERDLALSDIQLSLLQGFSFAAFFALFGFPIARLTDRGNRRTILACGIATWSLATAACGLARDFWVLFAGRVGVGAGEATLLPAATSLLVDLFPPERRGVALGVFASGIYLGSATALLAGGALLSVFAAHPPVLPVLGAVHPWQAVFIVIGLPGLVLAALLRALGEPARRAERRAATAPPAGSVVAQYRRDPVTLLCHHLGFTSIAFAGYAATAWIPTIFIRAHGWTAPEVGFRFGLLSLALGPLGSLAGGWLGDWFQRRAVAAGRFLVGCLAAVGMVVPGFLFPLAGDPWTGFWLCGLFIFVNATVWGTAAGVLQDVVPPPVLGRVTAVHTALLNVIALGLGPLSVAVLARRIGGGDALGRAASIIVPLASLVAAAAFWFGRRAYARAKGRVAADYGQVAHGPMLSH